MVRRGFAGFDDGVERAVGGEDQAAVAAGIGGLEAEHADGRAGAEFGQHRLQGLGSDEGRVAIKDENVAVEAFERGQGRENRVAGAELRLLADRDGVLVDVADRPVDGFGAVAGDDDAAIGVEAVGGGHRVLDERRAGQPVEHLPGRPTACGFPGRRRAGSWRSAWGRAPRSAGRF